MLFALVCTQGHMKFEEIQKECVPGKWAPLVVYRQDDKTILPLFESPKLARRFAERNLPKEWLTGIVNLNPPDGAILDKKGILQKLFTVFPNKLTDIVEFDIVVHEFDPDTEVEVQAVRPPC